MGDDGLIRHMHAHNMWTYWYMTYRVVMQAAEIDGSLRIRVPYVRISCAGDKLGRE